MNIQLVGLQSRLQLARVLGGIIKKNNYSSLPFGGTSLHPELLSSRSTSIPFRTHFVFSYPQKGTGLLSKPKSPKPLSKLLPQGQPPSQTKQKTIQTTKDPQRPQKEKTIQVSKLLNTINPPKTTLQTIKNHTKKNKHQGFLTLWPYWMGFRWDFITHPPVKNLQSQPSLMRQVQQVAVLCKWVTFPEPVLESEGSLHMGSHSEKNTPGAQ